MITKNNLLAIISIILCLTLSFAGISQSAVESSGEINAKDNNAGTVIAGTQAALILNIIIDMSQAEPGEEIESIRITVPNGLTAKDKAVKSVVIGDRNIPGFTQQIQDNNLLIVTLPTLITLTSRVAIEFSLDASAVPIPELQFIVGLIAINQRLLIASIKPGNADGRVNNDSLTLRSVSATKPLPPANLKVQPDANGENDLIITWSKVDEVGGYLIYRNDKGTTEIANVIGKDQTSYTDRDLEPISYTYTIRSYKTQALRSDPSAPVNGTATADTKAPEPPTIVPELKILDKGIEVDWKQSPSLDVVKYVIYRGVLASSVVKLSEVDATRNSYIDANRLIAAVLYISLALLTKAITKQNHSQLRQGKYYQATNHSQILLRPNPLIQDSIRLRSRCQLWLKEEEALSLSEYLILMEILSLRKPQIADQKRSNGTGKTTMKTTSTAEFISIRRLWAINTRWDQS